MSILSRTRRHGADPLTEPIERVERIPAFVSAQPEITPEARWTLAGLVAQAEAEEAARAFGADPLAAEYCAWYGWSTTMPDRRQPMARPYVPAYDGIAADINELESFRDAVHATFARAEPHHKIAGEDGQPVPCGFEPGGETWAHRYAAVYRHRTGAAPAPDFEIEKLWSA